MGISGVAIFFIDLLTTTIPKADFSFRSLYNYVGLACLFCTVDLTRPTSTWASDTLHGVTVAYGILHLIAFKPTDPVNSSAFGRIFFGTVLYTSRLKTGTEVFAVLVFNYVAFSSL